MGENNGMVHGDWNDGFLGVMVNSGTVKFKYENPDMEMKLIKTNWEL